MFQINLLFQVIKQITSSSYESFLLIESTLRLNSTDLDRIKDIYGD